MDEVTKQEEVTISMPDDRPIPQAPPITPKESLPIDPHGHIYSLGQDGIPTVTCLICNAPKEKVIGQPQVIAQPKNLGGRPCGYCKNKEAVDKKVTAYLEKAKVSEKGKTIMPFLEELCMELDIDEDTMSNWAHKEKEDGSLEHEWFFGAYKKIRLIQKLRLQQRTMGRFNPSGSIFLLKANHGMIESEKRILAGDKNEPINITITDDKKPIEEGDD